eukprot:682511-Hanusia_phi.AAC.1
MTRIRGVPYGTATDAEPGSEPGRAAECPRAAERSGVRSAVQVPSHDLNRSRRTPPPAPPGPTRPPA